ncbi:MAG: photosynthetic reaction center subunit H [Pseudomonadota bacterium]
MADNLFGSIDLVEILFTLFWVFFIALVVYLQRESRREGLPLAYESGGDTVSGRTDNISFKTFKKAHGGEVTVPRPVVERAIAAEPADSFPGAPLIPTGDPLVDGVGPAAWSDRQDEVDLTINGEPRIVPMRTQPSFHVDERDPDPRGMSIVAADGVEVGKVVDAWIDVPEPMIVYMEVDVAEAYGSGNVLVPFAFADKINKDSGTITVNAILAEQYARAPRTKAADTITLLEEEKVTAYFGGGDLLATPERADPLL